MRRPCSRAEISGRNLAVSPYLSALDHPSWWGWGWQRMVGGRGTRDAGRGTHLQHEAHDAPVEVDDRRLGKDCVRRRRREAVVGRVGGEPRVHLRPDDCGLVLAGFQAFQYAHVRDRLQGRAYAEKDGAELVVGRVSDINPVPPVGNNGLHIVQLAGGGVGGGGAQG